ncbi:MAG: GTP-binding protein [Prolixibacteraceae bacterium]|nr:GTP-binding protein [Prolixibacteraceae bacterium]
MPVKPKIPVIIVTGFLGAGKTCLINHLLAKNRGVKIGIIENEFGERSIDSWLIANYRPESILELNNGCICCSIFNEFSLALQELVKKHDHLEQLIIETTGVADPGPIIEPFFRDPDLMRLFELSGTICLVDGMNFLDQPLQTEQKKQIILSDMIVLNKINNTDTKKLPLIRKTILALNNTASLIETNHSRIDDSQFYLLHPNLQDEFLRKIKKPFYSEPEVTEFHSFTIRFGGFINETRFRNWFKYFASLHRKKIYRIKGIVNWDNNPLLGIVQSVGGTTSITEGSVVNPYEPIENVLVFIGKEISKFEIEKEFRQFLLQEN